MTVFCLLDEKGVSSTYLSNKWGLWGKTYGLDLKLLHEQVGNKYDNGTTHGYTTNLCQIFNPEEKVSIFSGKTPREWLFEGWTWMTFVGEGNPVVAWFVLCLWQSPYVPYVTDPLLEHLGQWSISQQEYRNIPSSTHVGWGPTRHPITSCEVNHTDHSTSIGLPYRPP